MLQGGDEVVYGCWFNDPKIKQWAQQKGFTTGKQVYKYFEDRLQMIVNPVSGKINRTVVVWDELFEEGIPMRSITNPPCGKVVLKLSVMPSYLCMLSLGEMIVQVWRSIDFLGQVIKAGYRGLLSAGFYLDKQAKDPFLHCFEGIHLSPCKLYMLVCKALFFHFMFLLLNAKPPNGCMQIPDTAQTWYLWEDTWKNFYMVPICIFFIEIPATRSDGYVQCHTHTHTHTHIC